MLVFITISYKDSSWVLSSSTLNDDSDFSLISSELFSVSIYFSDSALFAYLEAFFSFYLLAPVILTMFAKC